MDALAASIYSYVKSTVTPDAVFRYVASGVFGKEAFTGGLVMIAWGLLFHFIIATGWTMLFYLAYPKFKFLFKSRVLLGISYGLVVWLMMNLVVVPLSLAPSGPLKFTTGTFSMIMIHMFVIGVPIAFLSSKFYAKDE